MLLAMSDLGVTNLTLYLGLLLRFGTVIQTQYSERLLAISAIYSLSYMFYLISYGTNVFGGMPVSERRCF